MSDQKQDQCPAQNFIEQVDQMAIDRQAHFKKMTTLRKAQDIYRIASNAKKKEDIRDEVAELAYFLMWELNKEGKS